MRLFFAVIPVMLLIACTTTDIDNSLMISPGMTKQEVITTMGTNPVSNEFVGDLEEWHFCNTGVNSSRYIAVFFEGGRVFAQKPYTVSGVGWNQYGDCEIGVKKGTYREPDEVREYRIKVR
jgi:hypothetical protein